MVMVNKTTLNTDSYPALPFVITLSVLQAVFNQSDTFTSIWIFFFFSELDFMRPGINSSITIWMYLEIIIYQTHSFCPFVFRFKKKNQLSWLHINSFIDLCCLWLMALISPRCSYIYLPKCSVSSVVFLIHLFIYSTTASEILTMGRYCAWLEQI